MPPSKPQMLTEEERKRKARFDCMELLLRNRSLTKQADIVKEVIEPVEKMFSYVYNGLNIPKKLGRPPKPRTIGEAEEGQNNP